MFNLFGNFTHDEKTETVQISNSTFKAKKASGAYNLVFEGEGKGVLYPLPNLSYTGNGIYAEATGKMFGFTRSTEGKPHYRFSIALGNKIYLGCRAYTYTFDRLDKMVSKLGLDFVDYIHVNGQFSTAEVNGKTYYNLLVNSFEIISWKKKEDRKGVENKKEAAWEEDSTLAF